MELYCLPGTFSICKLASTDDFVCNGEYNFMAVTPNEIALLCPQKEVPDNAIARDDGWNGFRVKGTLDFALIGIIAAITDVLAQGKIPVYAVSTYDTDYFFIQQHHYSRACDILVQKGYTLSK